MNRCLVLAFYNYTDEHSWKIDCVEFDAEQSADLTSDDVISRAGGESRHYDVRQELGNKADVENRKTNLPQNRTKICIH